MANIPTFSPAEMDRRRRSIESAAAARDVEAVLIYGANRAGSAVQWITGWPATREAAVIVAPGRRDAMYVQFYNHVPAARRFASEAEVAWGGPQTVETVVAELRRRTITRLGVIGPLSWQAHTRLVSSGISVADMGGDYTHMRLVKSDEELSWMREGARLSDLAIEAVRDAAAPGVTDTQLGAACEAAFLATGATNHIHYFAITSMHEPDGCVPQQWPTGRSLSVGDALTCEISASWWGYSGQVLRTMAVNSEPSSLYAQLHDVAESAYDGICRVLRHGATPASVVEAAGVIEAAGFTIYDDLVHGYGGGYLPPILGSSSRRNDELPDMIFETGMTVVVQPNVITVDESAGVQTGGLVAITASGVEHLQRVPGGLWSV